VDSSSLRKAELMEIAKAILLPFQDLTSSDNFHIDLLTPRYVPILIALYCQE
jgi:hypothetical protein